MKVADLVIHRFDEGSPLLVFAVSSAPDGRERIYVQSEWIPLKVWRSARLYEVINESR